VELRNTFMAKLLGRTLAVTLVTLTLERGRRE